MGQAAGMRVLRTACLHSGKELPIQTDEDHHRSKSSKEKGNSRGTKISCMSFGQFGRSTMCIEIRLHHGGANDFLKEILISMAINGNLSVTEKKRKIEATWKTYNSAH